MHVSEDGESSEPWCMPDLQCSGDSRQVSLRVLRMEAGL